MAADTTPQASNEPNNNVHARDYAGFLNLLKWSVIAVAIISAVVIYLISN